MKLEIYNEIVAKIKSDDKIADKDGVVSAKCECPLVLQTKEGVDCAVFKAEKKGDTIAKCVFSEKQGQYTSMMKDAMTDKTNPHLDVLLG